MVIVSNEHLLAFGRLMYNFATVETGIKIALSAILKINLADAFVAFEPYGAMDLKNVAKSVAKQKLKPELAESFCCIVGDWAAQNSLRNRVAHSRWTKAGRNGAIKPRGFSIREGRAKTFGWDDGERSYTAADITAEAHKLRDVNDRLKTFLEESGLRRIIDDMIAEADVSTSDSSSKDRKHSVT